MDVGVDVARAARPRGPHMKAVAVGDAVQDDHQGWIEFGRPYGSLPPHDTRVRVERPVVGDLLLFPSYLFHRTLPYSGDGERISISFDLAAV